MPPAPVFKAARPRGSAITAVDRGMRGRAHLHFTPLSVFAIGRVSCLHKPLSEGYSDAQTCIATFFLAATLAVSASFAQQKMGDRKTGT